MDFFNKINLPTTGRESSNEIIKILISKGITIDQKLKLDEKSDKKSIIFRNDGNQMFRKNSSDFENLKAINKIYSKAIFHAESDIEKAYSYGNRSTSLFKMGMYSSCIADINRAIEVS